MAHFWPFFRLFLTQKCPEIENPSIFEPHRDFRAFQNYVKNDVLKTPQFDCFWTPNAKNAHFFCTIFILQKNSNFWKKALFKGLKFGVQKRADFDPKSVIFGFWPRNRKNPEKTLKKFRVFLLKKTRFFAQNRKIQQESNLIAIF